MREIICRQPQLQNIDISEIRPDPQSRDEIDRIAEGLIYIYSQPDIKKKIFSVIDKVIAPKSRKTGRPGMTLWELFVLGVFRNGCNMDYDRIQNIANNHKLIRQLLGHSDSKLWTPGFQYKLRTIKDNVSKLNEGIIKELNDIVVEAGHQLISIKKREELHCSVDSFVVETDVHFPSDISLLYDSLRVALETTADLCMTHNKTYMRQSEHYIKDLKRKLRNAQQSKRGGKTELIKKHHEIYVNKAKKTIDRINTVVAQLEQSGQLRLLDSISITEIQKNLSYAKKHIDLIERRVFNDEKIPNSDKMFSVFEPHTRWISKGKQSKLVELGVPVCIIKDQHGFILNHIIMETTADVDIAVEILEGAQKQHTNIKSCSYDKGFWSPDNHAKVKELVDKPVMPKKGKVSKAQQKEYDDEEYIRLRHKHSSVESTINSLSYSGLDRCLDHGIDGFKRYVGMGILSRNIQSIGNILYKKAAKKRNRKKSVRRNKAA